MTYILYFSPTGGTRRVMEMLSKGFDDVKFVDTTVHPVSLELTENDVCLIGVPSFGGRVPEAALNHLEGLSGNNAKAVAVAVYGNRHYDDTLLELQHKLTDKGLVVIAGIAAIAEHSVVRQFAAGRPDKNDAEELFGFGESIRRKIAECGDAVTLPGNVPYKEFGGAPFRPVLSGHCTQCGLCTAECPVGAIPTETPNLTNNEVCFACLRCISICPSKARILPENVIETMTERLRPVCEIPRQNILFL